MTPSIAVLVPVYGNESTLRPLATRLGAALAEHRWRLRFVIDASPDDSAVVAAELARNDETIVTTVLPDNVGQHRALAIGLDAEPDADVWVCLDADLQDPPEAVPSLIARLASGDVDVVFAGRDGTYESLFRRWTGVLHRRLIGQLTGLPPDAGAFLAMNSRARRAIFDLGGPSLVVALGAAKLPVTSLPTARDARPVGPSRWTSAARLRHSVRCLAWALSHRRPVPPRS
jgi:polyisoprenyl-phosphate glycosyltransferase